VWAPAPRQRPGSTHIDGTDPEHAADELFRILGELGVSGKKAQSAPDASASNGAHTAVKP
jgi:hypothetical protein